MSGGFRHIGWDGSQVEHDAILKAGVQQGASDVHLRAGLPPMLRVQGVFVPLKGSERLTADQTLSYAANLMTREQKERFAIHMALALAYEQPTKIPTYLILLVIYLRFTGRR